MSHSSRTDKRSPLVSIIVPVYNTEEYLRQCIESVLAQTYSDWELILIDDGSRDASGQICDIATRSTSRIKVVHTKNHGLSAARNTGLDKARGEYITFLDSDDILHPLFLELMMNKIMRYKAEIVACEIKKFADGFDSYSSIAMRLGFDSYVEKMSCQCYAGSEITRKALYQRTINCSACGKLFSRRLWKEKRFREGTMYEDLDIIPRILLDSRLTAIYDIALYFYCQHGESFLHTFSFRRTDVLEVTRRLVVHMSAISPSLRKGALDRQMSANFNILGLMEANIPRLEGEEREKASSIADECWGKIKELRAGRLLDRRVRLKNKAGIIISYIGGIWLLKLLYRR